MQIEQEEIIIDIPIVKRITVKYNQPTFLQPSPCDSCPNAPHNGGSGFCHCTLNLPKITC
jgi:hypothetical protein